MMCWDRGLGDERWGSKRSGYFARSGFETLPFLVFFGEEFEWCMKDGWRRRRRVEDDMVTF
jgi:hypothetical protein